MVQLYLLEPALGERVGRMRTPTHIMCHLLDGNSLSLDK